MNALLKLMRYRQFLGQGGSGDSGGSSADFLTLKETMTEYRNDEMTEVPAHAFCGCTGLTVVDVPSATTLGDYAFYGCKNLKHLFFPAVRDFGGYTFKDAGVEIMEFSQLTGIPVWDNGYEMNGALCDLDVHLVLRQKPFYLEDPTYYGVRYFYVPREYLDRLFSVEDEDGNYTEGSWGYGWDEVQSRVRTLEDYTVDGTITGELDLAKMGIEL